MLWENFVVENICVCIPMFFLKVILSVLDLAKKLRETSPECLYTVENDLYVLIWRNQAEISQLETQVSQTLSRSNNTQNHFQYYKVQALIRAPYSYCYLISTCRYINIYNAEKGSILILHCVQTTQSWGVYKLYQTPAVHIPPKFLSILKYLPSLLNDL